MKGARVYEYNRKESSVNSYIHNPYPFYLPVDEEVDVFSFVAGVASFAPGVAEGVAAGLIVTSGLGTTISSVTAGETGL